jgi:hypothetical protein
MTRALDMVMSFLLSVKDGATACPASALGDGRTDITPHGAECVGWTGRRAQAINSVISVPDHGLTSV